MTFTSLALALAISSICSQDATAFLSPSSSSFSSSTSIQPNRFHASSNPQIPKCGRQQQQQQQQQGQQQGQFQLFSTTDTDLEAEISSMRVAAIKQELESYGISTRTFLEKGELVVALVQARKEGKSPVSTTSSASSSSSSSSSSASSNSESSSTSTATTTTTTATTASTEDRNQRLLTERENCKSLKVSELKSELESYGVSTNTYFEKSEFVKALAEARVDGVKKSKKKKRRAAVVDDDDVEEVTAAKVEVITNDNEGPKTKKTRDANDAGAGAGNPFGGAGGNPFGGGGGGPGGMGGMDMGNIADMLKGMGGMGGAPGGAAGGNPFGGAAAGGGGGNPFGGMPGGGGNPFGGGGGGGMDDAMKAAQQAMSNPKVMAVIQKAQKNPKVMAAVQECMGNPMAMAKYMSDPEVGPILKELQDAMM
eukprot:CAMPEP_0201662012 /NCGR_PEP_ID=MMETSP0494-20130426/4222_1 /ASSEMBLY_ACC=CAM_ASM_000839 /TAXON_ID=420259 /ORGANISM="Thalassiosira gravida, Strain GMp14c1" /LENGTH=423 /DNA_ID=CAMNT_0048140277 /DNA_START=31 /DNA_END=1302 /DNA_ORIENTATION=+